MLQPTLDRSATSKTRGHRRSRIGRGFLRAWQIATTTVFVLAVTGHTAFAGVTITPTAPPGVNGIQDLLNWTMYGGAIACAGTMIFGFAKMGLSHQNQSYSGANHGKAVAMLGLVGALGLGLTPTIVNGLTAIH